MGTIIVKGFSTLQLTQGAPRHYKPLMQYKARAVSDSHQNLSSASSSSSDASQKGPTAEELEARAEREARKFTVLQYNVLADLYTQHQWFKYCDPNYLSFQHRGQLVIDLVKYFHPDILCFQELDHYEDFYRPRLCQDLSYDTVYLRKGQREEGVMIAFNTRKFRLAHQEVLEYARELPERLCNQQIYKLDNNALVVELEHLHSQEKVFVVSSHIFWNPSFEHVKYFQIATLLKTLSTRYTRSDNVILTGDFNSLPESNQLKLIMEKKKPLLERVPEKYRDSVSIGDEEFIFDSVKQYLKLNLMSAYFDFNDGDHPVYTTYTETHHKTLDYIFFNCDSKLRVEKVLQIPSEEDLTGFIPNKNFASDHLPIMAQFMLSTHSRKVSWSNFDCAFEANDFAGRQ